MFIKRLFGFMILGLLFGVPNTEASEMTSLQNEVTQLRQVVMDLKSVVESQSIKIEYLEGQLSKAKTPAQPQEAPQRLAEPKWTPDIGVVADVVAKFDSPKEDAEGADRVSVRELELVFASAVDPYSRFDSLISFSDFEDPSVEEAYLTHFALPFDITGRFGKFKPKAGKALPIHRDSLDTVDEPLVIQRYFGLEGLNKAGADFTKGFDSSWPLPHEVTFGVLEGGNGEEGTLFGTARRRPTIYSHIETYKDIDDVTGLEIGASHFSGSKDDDPSLETHVIATDATLVHHLSPNERLKLQTEAFFVHRQETNLDPDESTDLRIEDSPWGIYGLIDLRFNRQWSTGFRYDYVELIDNPITNPHNADRAYTGYITFYQSEFARWRAQFTHIDKADDTHDNQVFLQGTFAIGEHKHKIN